MECIDWVRNSLGNRLFIPFSCIFNPSTPLDVDESTQQRQLNYNELLVRAMDVRWNENFMHEN